MGLKQIRCEHQEWIQIAENTPLKDLNLITFTYNLLPASIFYVLQTQLRSPLSSYWHFPTVQKQNKIMHPKKLCTWFMNSMQPNYHMSSY